MTKRRFVNQYAAYLLARSMPAVWAGGALLAAHRFRYRKYWVPPRVVSAKPRVVDDGRSVRHQEEDLLARMTATFVVDGDWDLGVRPFDLHPVVEDLFVRQLPMRSTRTYAEMLSAIRDGDTVKARGYSGPDDVKRYFEHIELLYESLQRDGYRTQLRRWTSPGDEITVCVGRNGRVLLLRYGNHRTSIAKLLDIPRVPVIVRGVHEEWVQARIAEFSDDNAMRAIERGLKQIGLPWLQYLRSRRMT